LAYLRTPDPAYPTNFDFRSHTMFVPLWVAAMVNVGTVWINGLQLMRGYRLLTHKVVSGTLPHLHMC
jgi:hypothetical protein